MSDDDLNAIVCFGCGGDPRAVDCAKCEGTGRVFWVYGRTFPHNEKGKLYGRARIYRNEKAAPK